jgi:hypothetical protein
MTTQRINDPLRAKSRHGIKGNFETWTLLGLFVSTDKHYVNDFPEGESRSVPAALDPQRTRQARRVRDRWAAGRGANAR